jgi:DNA-binding phage protein
MPRSKMEPERHEDSRCRKVPERVDPLVRLAYLEMMRQQLTYGEVAHESGVSVTTLRTGWKHHQSPSLPNLRAVLYSLGYRLVAVPINYRDDGFGRTEGRTLQMEEIKGTISRDRLEFDPSD